MKGFVVNIEEETRANTNFRHVKYTANYMQMVYMSLRPGEEIGLETHGNDQFFRFEQGVGRVYVDDNQYDVTDGSGVIVPAGAKHNVVNVSDDQELKLYTIYAGPHHEDGIVATTKSDAESMQEEFDGHTTE